MIRYRHRKNPRTEDDDFRVFLDYLSGIDSVEFLAEAHNIPVASVEMILDVYLDDALDDSQELRFNPSGRLPKFTEAQKEEIAEKYRNDESHTLASLALEYNCSAPTIKTILIQKNASLRGSHTTLSPAQERKLIRRYKNEPDTSIASLATDFSISTAKLYEILRRHEIEPSRPQRGAQRALTSDQELELIRRYQEEPDSTLATLAADFSISTRTLQNVLKRHGVAPSRNLPGEPRALTPDQEIELIRRYQEESDTTIETLCSEFSILKLTLYRILKLHGLEPSRPAWSPPRALTPDQERELIRRYQEEPETTIETLISAFSITLPTLYRILKRHEIELTRPRGGSRSKR